jgi:hypothetical protein
MRLWPPPWRRIWREAPRAERFYELVQLGFRSQNENLG